LGRKCYQLIGRLIGPGHREKDLFAGTGLLLNLTGEKGGGKGAQELAPPIVCYYQWTPSYRWKEAANLWKKARLDVIARVIVCLEDRLT